MSREMQNKQATNDKRPARMPIKCSTGRADFLFIQEKKRKDKIFCFHPFAITQEKGEGGINRTKNKERRKTNDKF